MSNRIEEVLKKTTEVLMEILNQNEKLREEIAFVQSESDRYMGAALNAHERIKELEARLSNSSKSENKEEKEDKWPKVDDEYFFINGRGNVNIAYFFNQEDILKMVQIGNCYRTDDAKRGALATQASRKLRLWADQDRVANQNFNGFFRCAARNSDGILISIGPAFATEAARDLAQDALTKEEWEVLI